MIILYEQEDGNIAIIHPADDKAIEDLESDIPENSRFKISSEDLLPTDLDLKEFADAMRVDFDKEENYIFFDMEIAREITKNRLRKERKAFFEANDIALRDALIEEDNEKKQRALIERDRLRDLPLIVYTVDTLDSLRNLHP
jgi:hypothetical protein